MTYVAILGLVAAFLTTISFVPQVLKIWRTRHTADISLKMFVIYTIGVFLWLVYGLMLGDLPLILSNIITFALTLSILIMKLRYG